jgi:hypothetical protein
LGTEEIGTSVDYNAPHKVEHLTKERFVPR